MLPIDPVTTAACQMTIPATTTMSQTHSEIAAGQTRVLLAWDRLIMPDGRSIVLERQPGTDGAGFAGLQDRVNQHWGNLLKAAAVSTLLGVGAELGADSEDDLTRALRRGSQDTINQTGQQIVRRQLDTRNNPSHFSS